MTPRFLVMEPRFMSYPTYKGCGMLAANSKYEPPAFLTPKVELQFILDPGETEVQSTLHVRHNAAGSPSLVLNGKKMTLKAIALNGRPLSPDEYRVEENTLTVLSPPPERGFVLTITNTINPRKNTQLQGLYESNGILVTQCEPDGFSNITYSIDRPDNPTRFQVTLIADKDKYPVLLSNGNRLRQEKLPDNKHLAEWENPFPMPSYLFAIVAGQLEYIEEIYTTKTGKKVTIRVWANAHNIKQCQHALVCVTKAMAWDEAVFGFEYDLTVFNLVAIEDFNAGAMENKSLNIFNAPALLATPNTAIDPNYLYVEMVVAHEFFHNYRGDRVTIRDWRWLALKEAFTEFSTQWFMGDSVSPVTRIDHVGGIREVQFPEDQGPLAHPIVPPEGSLEHDNLYTATVYDKGAEVFRALGKCLGQEAYMRGIQRFFQQYDGQAVTIEEFMRVMEEVTRTNLSQFRLWFYQAGTPKVSVTTEYDAERQTFTLHCKQTVAPTPKQPEKQPLSIPIEVALLDKEGQEMPLRFQEEEEGATTSRILKFYKAEDTFVFVDIPEKPVPSLLRGFSAPVDLTANLSNEELAFLFTHDSDVLNRWDAGQTLLKQEALRLVADYQNGNPLVIAPILVEAFRALLSDASVSPWIVAECLTLPSESGLAQEMKVIAVEAISNVRDFLVKALAEKLILAWHQAYFNNAVKGPYQPEPEAIGKRQIRNLALSYFMALNTHVAQSFARKQLREATNLTERYAAFVSLVHLPCFDRTPLIEGFYENWKHEPLVILKWLSAQASSPLPGTLEEVKKLLKHPEFEYTNPNKVSAVIGVFVRNFRHFHDASGSGYVFLGEQIQTLDPINSHTAARLMNGFRIWKRLDAKRQERVKAVLESIRATPNLSLQVKDMADRLLAE
ncbi:MAG: aminopeptidase N [Gammaproteobacteria bacterium]|nr:aminopeptidase N [Gammaproteobacteria bacterium]